MVLVLGILALLVVVAGVVLVIALARRQARIDAAPESQPTDFVAPVSSGGYRFRQTDETEEAFKERIARENAEALPDTKPRA